MKRLFLILVAFSFAILGALSLKPKAPDKALHQVAHEASSLELWVSNYGTCHNLRYPRYSPDNLMYAGGIWIGGKIPRRDEEGRRLFWLHPDPYIDDSITHEGAPDWNAELKPVIDSLTSVGIEGDLALFELLPTYNPRATSNPRYTQYYLQDTVLQSFLGFPSPRGFVWPDPLDNYCFSSPQPVAHDSPGFETLTGFFYDFCPLGSPGKRTMGPHVGFAHHYPLGLGIKRESFAWNLQNHDSFVIFRITIYNMNELDEIQDLAFGEYVDADIYPAGWENPQATQDDISGYDLVGEYAYSRDYNGDLGLSPFWVGNKIICYDFEGQRAAWAWDLGFSPNDNEPRALAQTNRQTANEKYWLMTGRNPRPNTLFPLRSQDANIPVQEQPYNCDTRFLNVIHGSQPSAQNPDPVGRLNLAPGDSLTYYSVYFVGEGRQEMREIAQRIDNFIASGMEIDPNSGLSCIPYLKELEFVDNQAARLQWHSYTDPDHFEVQYKTYEDSAAQWISTQVPGNSRSLWLWDLDPDTWYEFRVAAVYQPGPEEVYLKSNTRMTKMNLPSEFEPETPPLTLSLENFPNPFSHKTVIKFDINTAGPVKLRIFNAKGQLTRELHNDTSEPGTFSKIWDGRDDRGSLCAPGIYFLGLDCAGTKLVKKVLLLRN